MTQPTVAPVTTLDEQAECSGFDPSTVAPVTTQTRITRITRIREEPENPVYQEKNVSTGKTPSNGTLIGYREGRLQDGTKITIPVYE